MDSKHKNIVVICGARCVSQKDGKCRNEFIKVAAAVIGNDGQCVRFETAEKK